MAIYPFTDPGDAAKFFKVKGTKCSRKPLAIAMTIKVGTDTAQSAPTAAPSSPTRPTTRRAST